MKIIIKKATPTDWEIIQNLNSQVYLADKDSDEDLILDQPFSEKNINYYKRLAAGEYGYCAIAFIDSKPVGYAAAAKKKFGHRKGKYVEIENMGVDKKYRSKGIGKDLIDDVAVWAVNQGAKKLYVVAYWKNEGAIGFYKKNDFYEIGLQLERKLIN